MLRQVAVDGPLVEQFQIPQGGFQDFDYALAVTSSSEARLAYEWDDGYGLLRPVYMRSFDGNSWGPRVAAGVDESGERRSSPPVLALAEDGRGILSFGARPTPEDDNQARYARLLGGSPDLSEPVTLDATARVNYFTWPVAVADTGDVFAAWPQLEDGQHELHV